MDPDQARRLIADEPRYDWGFQEGRTCSVCGVNVLSPDRDRHTRWHRALAAALGVGWEDLSLRPVPAPLADAVDAVVHPRGLRRLSGLVTAAEPWRVVADVPLGAHGAPTLLLGSPGVVVARAVGTASDRLESRGGVLLVNGHRSAHTDELRGAVRRVREVLSAARGRAVTVAGVLVALGTLDGGDPDPPEVLAATTTSLPDRLARLPEGTVFGEIDLLHDLARRSTTWG